MTVVFKEYGDRKINAVAEIIVERLLAHEEIDVSRRELEKSRRFCDEYRKKSLKNDELSPESDTLLEEVAREAMLWYIVAKKTNPCEMLPKGPNKLLNLLVQTTLYAWKLGILHYAFSFVDQGMLIAERGDKERSEEDSLIPYGLYRKNVEKMTEKTAMKYLPGVLRYVCWMNDPLVTAV